jgi:ribonuclease HI
MMMYPDSGIIAGLTGCTPEQAQAALEALIGKGWAPPSDGTEHPATNSEAVEPAAPSAPDNAPAKGLLIAHTDGACSGNPGPGGWAVVFSRSGDVVGECSGAAAATTSNRMELIAVLEAVRRTPKRERLEIHTDSRNVVGWLAEGWKRNNATLAALRREIDELAATRGPEGTVSFHHVRGHRGDELNRRADQLATAAIKKVRRKAARR